MIEPKITVIIPTRERCDVLEKSLQTVTAQNYDNLDIIVSDNFSTDDTEDVVRSANDARVRYISTGERLSMSHNWEFALSNVDDAGWVTIIGDDDGLLPGSLNKIAEIIQSTGVAAIRTSVCSYRWPSSTNTHPVQLEVPLGSGHELRQSSLWLAKVLSGDAAYPELPMLYNGGFISMSVVREIKSKSGAFYNSCIPDVYSAVAISSVIDRYIFSREPLAISGSSRHSIGASQFSKSDDSGGSPAEKFASEGNLPFHEDIPLDGNGLLPKSLQIMVYESYLQSRSLRPAVAANMHAEQLEVILAASGVHESLINEWGMGFARKHKLDYDLIRAKSRRRKAFLKVASIAKLASLAMNTDFVASPKKPIKDIFGASIAADAIRANIPGPTRRLLKLVRHVVNGSLKIGAVLKK